MPPPLNPLRFYPKTRKVYVAPIPRFPVGVKSFVAFFPARVTEALGQIEINSTQLCSESVSPNSAAGVSDPGLHHVFTGRARWSPSPLRRAVAERVVAFVEGRGRPNSTCDRSLGHHRETSGKCPYISSLLMVAW
jgi:hypothetical protein